MVKGKWLYEVGWVGSAGRGVGGGVAVKRQSKRQ